MSILKSVQKKFPSKSGVYIFFDKQGKELYIGKAKNLRKRTEYYFKEDIPKRFKRMVSQAVDFKYFITKTENEALLLETQLIKEKKPIYNILYKNGRSLYYIVFSKHEFSQVLIVNEWELDAVGPFISREYAQNLLNALLKIFKARVCSDYTIAHRKRPCLEYYANRCSAPCVGLIENLEYHSNIEAFKKIFSQKENARVLKQWNSDLKEFVKKEHFEQAAQKRDQIIALEKLNQSIHFGSVKQLDVILQNKNDFYIEKIKDGVIVHIEHRKYDKTISFDEFLFEYYLQEPTYKILTATKTSEKKFLAKTKVEKQILNAALVRMRSLLGQDSYAQILELQILNSIETYDSSHYAGKHARCGMVYYDISKQEFIKSKYRIWKNKNSFNDLEILKNALQRRAKLALPDMILLDGGITQLGAAKEALKGYENIFAFAKGLHRKGGILYNVHGKVVLDSANEDNSLLQKNLLLLLEKLRSEAHRHVNISTRNSFSKEFKTG